MNDEPSINTPYECEKLQELFMSCYVMKVIYNYIEERLFIVYASIILHFTRFWWNYKQYFMNKN